MKSKEQQYLRDFSSLKPGKTRLISHNLHNLSHNRPLLSHKLA